MDFKLDSTGDIIWHNGPLLKSDTTQPYTENVAQRLYIKLRTFQGEWFINTTYGVPYWQRILGIKQRGKAAIDLIMQTAILEEVGVKEIVSFNSTFNNRQYSLEFQVRVVDGTITNPIVVDPIS